MSAPLETREAMAVDGLRLAYRATPATEAPTVVLLHSLGTDGRMWDACAQTLSGNLRLVIPDTRGHGASEAAPTASIERWVDDLEAVLAAAKVEEAMLVGVSMGGIQAMAYAAAHPESVRGLVVADSFAALPEDVAEAKVAAMTGMARRRPMAEVADQYIEDTFQAPYPDGVDAVRTAIAGMDPASYLAAVETCFRVQIADRLEAIEAPTRVLWGDRDTKTPLPLAEQIADLVPNCTLGLVSGAGHLANVDQPEQFAREVVKHCRESGPWHVRVGHEGSRNDG